MKLIYAVLISIVTPTLALSVSAQNQKEPPATLRSLLLHELKTTHNKAEWFVPINTAVEGLTAQQASWQPKDGTHSAGQLAYHLLFWNRRSLRDLKGESQEKFAGSNDETFTKFDDKQWSDIVKGLDEVMTDYEKFVETVDEKKLATIAPTIGNVSTHNAYHVGQIIYARKLQGSWDPEKGVK